MRPLLFIGLGGAGGKTLRALKQTLNLELRDKGYSGEIPSAWQFLHIDLQLDGLDFPAPQLNAEEICMLVPPGASYGIMVRTVESHFSDDSELCKLLAGWAWHWNENPLGPPKNLRPVARLTGLGQASNISQAIRYAVSKMTSSPALAELASLSKHLGAKTYGQNPYQVPQVVLVSSLVGGTGSALLIDVAEILKRTVLDTWARQSVSFLYTADVFDNSSDREEFGLKSLATISELLSGAIGPLGPEAKEYFRRSGFPDIELDAPCGPSFNYLVGAKNLNGVQFESDKVFSKVAQILSTAALETEFAHHLFEVLPVNIGMRARTFGEIKVPSQCAAYASLGIAKTESPRPDVAGDTTELARAPVDFNSQSSPMISGNKKFVEDANVRNTSFEFIDNGESRMIQICGRGFLPFGTASITGPAMTATVAIQKEPSEMARFMSYRARPLRNSILLDEPGLVTMICGWFVAKIFKLIDMDGDPPNTSLRLLNPVTQNYCWFPNPVYKHRKSRDHSQLPSILESLPLAWINYGESGDLTHLEVYQVLKQLGTAITESFPLSFAAPESDLVGEFISATGNDGHFRVLGNWIEHGELSSGIALTPREIFDTVKLETLVDRKQAASGYLERLISGHSNLWDSCEGVSWDRLPEIWQLKEEIMESLETLKEYVSIFPIDQNITI